MHKAAYLAERNRKAEALAIYERLLKEPSLMSHEPEGVRHNPAVLRG